MTFSCFQINNILLSQRHGNVTHVLRRTYRESFRRSRQCTSELHELQRRVSTCLCSSHSLSLSRAERNIVLHREDVGDSANARAHPTPASFEEYSRNGCTVTGCGHSLYLGYQRITLREQRKERATIPPVNRACLVIRVSRRRKFTIDPRS